MPYPATQVTTPPGVWLTDPELMVFSQYHGASVQTYQATSVDVDPTAAQLRAAPEPPRACSRPGAPGVVPDDGAEADRGRAHGRPDHRVRQGQRAGRLALGADVRLQRRRGAGQLRGHPVQLPDQDPPRRLRPVGVGDDGPDPAAGHPGPAGGRLHRGHPRVGKDLRGQDRRRARVGRGVLLGLRLDQVRGHPAGGDGTAQASSYQSGTGTGSSLPPVIPGSIGSSAGPTKAQPTAGGRGQQVRRRRRTGRSAARRPSPAARRGRRSSWPYSPPSPWPAGSSRSWPRPRTGRCRPMPPTGPGGGVR